MLPGDQHWPAPTGCSLNQLCLIALRIARYERQIQRRRQFKHGVLWPQALTVFGNGRGKDDSRGHQSLINQFATKGREKTDQGTRALPTTDGKILGIGRSRSRHFHHTVIAGSRRDG